MKQACGKHVMHDCGPMKGASFWQNNFLSPTFFSKVIMEPPVIGQLLILFSFYKVVQDHCTLINAMSEGSN